jgi:hypothetical protein
VIAKRLLMMKINRESMLGRSFFVFIPESEYAPYTNFPLKR